MSHNVCSIQYTFTSLPKGVFTETMPFSYSLFLPYMFNGIAVILLFSGNIYLIYRNVDNTGLLFSSELTAQTPTDMTSVRNIG